ncbi:conserved hypothetical protein [Talaromyces stipitatus ATCC 10500]|uniref:Uncharacterized protein n=1 Tax=Talaromyces stipitatus (strain ATCC 10500 / CBS 375.48 / QM 6759 / NRRL 1006) TaxID=441959 RepID=B8LW61_TALSN|nr:uncharacterized protein TSTA_074670 [Talaromyces stipitatus ATCC 10500]EED24089.1 conserved hypothetical protein [Talaromyces stipitatus ATCC 10500]
METTFRNLGSTPVLIPNRFDTKQKTTTYRTDAPPEIPPSPTLTNPDMILPDDGERQSLTPSPPFQLAASNSQMLQNGLQPQNGNYSSNGSTYRAPRPRWTYEGHAHGRPLSDIGEEDSQASTSPYANRYTSQAHQSKSDADSDGSGSTISAGSQRQLNLNPEGLREDGNDSGFNSKRSSFASEGSIERARAQASDALTSGPSQQSEEETSSAILSSEAERILENAKRRLTLMEGNLSRARSSIRLGQTPSPSPTSPGLLLPSRNLQPAGALYRSISQTDRRVSLLRPRPVYTAQQEGGGGGGGGGGGHSRGRSETNLPSTAILKSPSLQPSRSMSALASSDSIHYDSRENTFPYNAASSNGSQESRQDSRQGDGHRRGYLSPGLSGSAGLGISTSKTKMSSMDDFNSAYPPDGPPSRAQSQLQVRDLKDQAAGLRTKVALLKVKTQEDNLRRRSLQSLRTPSPFTAAERWYSSALEHGNGTDNVHSNAGYGWVSPKTETKPDSNGQSTSNGTDEFTTDIPLDLRTHKPTSKRSQHINDDFTIDNDDQSVLESHYEDAEEGDYDDGIDREQLNEILNEPFDDEDENDIFEDFPTGTAPEATPHEEREDAFDYENFYLHSALGTFSRNKMRRHSYGSTGSTETTRPAQDHRPSRHGRHGSSDSVSTFATFATATENAYDDVYDDDQEDALQAIDQIVDNWNDFEDEGGPTPVQSRRATVIDRSDESCYLEATRNRATNGPFTPTRKTLPVDRKLSTPTTPVDAFMSSLSSRSASTRPPSSLNTDDTRLLEQVFESLGKVCTELQELTMAASAIAGNNGLTINANGGTIPTAADPKYIRTLRRRLDAARRVLDGQLDSDA